MLRTLSHLRASQIWHRVRLVVRRRWWSAQPDRVDARYRERAAACAPLRWSHAGLAALADARAAARDTALALACAHDAANGRFTLLGETRDLGVPVPWDRPDLMQALLWKTHLHEFGWALDLAIAFRATGDHRHRTALFSLARDWQAAQPIGKRGFQRVAWNERVVATRILHWSVAGALVGLREGDPDAEWLGREIARHALFLRDNLALDLLANHLFRDCVGLVFADALCGCTPDAQRLLEREVREQILADGAHVERCPMYHAVCLADLVDLRTLQGDATPAWLRDAVARAGGFLEAILLGDGDLPLLGDGWRGEVDVAPLLARARALETLRAPDAPHATSGIAPLVRGPLRLVARVGAHGPDHQLGHAHADLLSFDLSAGARRVVTDTGTGLYAAGPVRSALRSTAAHNTLQIDGAELLEAWSSFRSGRRGRAVALARGANARFEWLAAAHDAYAFLDGAPRPQRLWLLARDTVWIVDVVRGAGRHRIASRLHLHPEAPGDLQVAAIGGGALRRETAPLHERFGETREMTRVVVEVETALPWAGGFRIGFGAAPATPPELALDGDVARLRGDEFDVTWRLDARDARAVAIETRAS